MYDAALFCMALTLALHFVWYLSPLNHEISVLFILCQSACFTSWWENLLWALKFSSSSLFSHVTYITLFPSVHCVLIFYHIITIFTIAYLFRICYVCFLNTTVPLPSLYFLVIKVWYILNSCLRRRDLSYLHSTVQWSNGKLQTEGFSGPSCCPRFKS